MANRKPTLLIVDDDERLRSLVCAAAVKSEAFESIMDEYDGQAALELVRQRSAEGPERLPNFILTDLSMPRMDGLELVRELKRDPATTGIPVAMMTSSNRPNDREDARAAGCCAFFDKPVRLEDFVTIVAAVPDLCAKPVG